MNERWCLIKVRKIPLRKLTVGTLMKLKQDGIKVIIDGDEKVLRIIPPNTAHGTRLRRSKRQVRSARF